MLELTVDPLAAAGALAAAVFFGIEGVLGKRGMESGGNALLAALLVAVVSAVVFGGAAAVTGLDALAANLVGTVVFFTSGVVASGLGVVAIWQGVDRVGASVNTAVVNTRPMFATAFGFLVLGETVSVATLGGIFVLVTGLVAIGMSKGGDVSGWRSVALAYPLCAAGCFAVGNVARRYALVHSDLTIVDGLGANAVGGLLVLGSFVLLSRPARVVDAPRRAYAWFLTSGTATATALILLFFALERSVVAIVDALAAVAPAFTLVFTWLFLGGVERITRRLAAGVVLVVLGAVLILGF